MSSDFLNLLERLIKANVDFIIERRCKKETGTLTRSDSYNKKARIERTKAGEKSKKYKKFLFF